MNIDIEDLIKNLEQTKDYYMINHLNNIAPSYHSDALQAIEQLQARIKELEKLESALKKISKYGVYPRSESTIDRIKRLKGIADKSLYVLTLPKLPEGE